MKQFNKNVVLPEGSLKLSAEEMRIIEGGKKIHLSNEFLGGVVSVLGLGGPTIIAGLSIPVVASAITAASGAVAGAIAAVPGLNLLAGALTAAIAFSSVDLAAALIENCKYKKGIDLHIGWSGSGPSFDFKARKK